MGFKKDFKYFKRKEKFPDLSNVMMFNNCIGYKDVKIKDLKGKNFKSFFGLCAPCQWKIYEFMEKPGLIFIRNPFSSSGQRYWITRCLQDYTKKPSKLNIDAHNLLPCDENWWDFCLRNSDTEKSQNMLKKLRWATLGYHHNWETKEYDDNLRSEFPVDLYLLCKYIGDILGFPNFNAEAAIINIYHFGSSLSGHTDHSELNLTAPLFSFSFGQSAIFLIGGKSVEEETLPILIESGDILIMSGESRLCYHGVPRIIESREEFWNVSEESTCEKYEKTVFVEDVINNLKNDKFWKPFENYVKKSRLNLNVRQVLLPGQKTLRN